MILFVETLTISALRGHSTKIKTLLSVAFYIFILVYPPSSTYSLYSMFAPILGTFWYIFFILIGFLYFFFGHLFPKESEGVRAESRKLSGPSTTFEVAKEVALDRMEAGKELGKVKSQLAAARAEMATLTDSHQRSEQQKIIAALINEEKALEHRMKYDSQVKEQMRKRLN